MLNVSSGMRMKCNHVKLKAVKHGCRRLASADVPLVAEGNFTEDSRVKRCRSIHIEHAQFAMSMKEIADLNDKLS